MAFSDCFEIQSSLVASDIVMSIREEHWFGDGLRRADGVESGQSQGET